MKRQVFAAIFIVLGCVAQPALAQQKPAWQRQPTPYSGLFQPQDLKTAARQQQEARPSQQPRVVCGMLVIPMDPNIDPKMIVPRPTDGTRYTIRVIPSPVCK